MSSRKAGLNYAKFAFSICLVSILSVEYKNGVGVT